MKFFPGSRICPILYPKKVSVFVARKVSSDALPLDTFKPVGASIAILCSNVFAILFTDLISFEIVSLPPIPSMASTMTVF